MSPCRRSARSRTGPRRGREPPGHPLPGRNLRPRRRRRRSRRPPAPEPPPAPAPDPGPSPDTDAPETTITQDAPKRIDATKVTFRFVSDELGSTFACKLDKKRFKPCDSPEKLKRLDQGKHKFKVRATDPAGNVDTSPAKDKFRVVD